MRLANLGDLPMSITDAIAFDAGSSWLRRAVEGAMAGLPAGAAYAAITGACCGFPIGWAGYRVGWILSCPLYGLVGALVGSLAGAIVGASGGAARSVAVGAITGCGVALMTGIVLFVVAWIAAGEPMVLAPGQAINPGATADEERELERVHLRGELEEIDINRRANVVFFVIPVILCILLATVGASRSLARRFPNSEPQQNGK
jgi:hypothetical protein